MISLSLNELPQSSLLVLPAEGWEGLAATLASQINAADIYLPEDWTKPLAVKQVRELRAKAAQTPVGEKALFVIPWAHTMQRESANALLKVLEEPPAYAWFILMAETATILPTLASRVRTYAVGEGEQGQSTRYRWKEILQGYNPQDPTDRETLQKLLYLYPLIHSTVQSGLVEAAFEKR